MGLSVRVQPYLRLQTCACTCRRRARYGGESLQEGVRDQAGVLREHAVEMAAAAATAAAVAAARRAHPRQARQGRQGQGGGGGGGARGGGDTVAHGAATQRAASRHPGARHTRGRRATGPLGATAQGG